MHVHVLHDWHVVHAGRVHVLRWPGRLLFACGDYFLLKVRATARTQRMPEDAHVLTAPRSHALAQD